jgi:hypothetical protein
MNAVYASYHRLGIFAYAAPGDLERLFILLSPPGRRAGGLEGRDRCQLLHGGLQPLYVGLEWALSLLAPTPGLLLAGHGCPRWLAAGAQSSTTRGLDFRHEGSRFRDFSHYI